MQLIVGVLIFVQKKELTLNIPPGCYGTISGSRQLPIYTDGVSGDSAVWCFLHKRVSEDKVCIASVKY